MRAEEAEFANEERNQIGLKLVSSRSRIARRMLEQLGYHVVKVDRVTLGPLTKKTFHAAVSGICRTPKSTCSE